jgi:hypothetical protein
MKAYAEAQIKKLDAKIAATKSQFNAKRINRRYGRWLKMLANAE